MDALIPLKRPDARPGDYREETAEYEVEPFDLYGRHHEVSGARAKVGITRVSEGLHIDLQVRATVRTTCDRTLEPVEIEVCFGESEVLSGPDDPELSIEDWTLDLPRYTRSAIPTEIPMQIFAPGTEPVRPGLEEERVDPRWRGLGDLFASGF
ncbi:YceD family protein [Rubrobacter calidifluminis]|uniref:YceD family protein n=1 Tax=Rubrobacter calidifluminis TaxID=1392640 RepID=UPI002361EFD8|nr:DUF177 domain-containing protein [Rubrobacter calidifluminis]